MIWEQFPHYWPFVRGIHWNPSQKADLWCFLRCTPERKVEQTVQLPVIFLPQKSKLHITGLCEGNPPTTSRGIHRTPGDSPHKGPVTWRMFSFDDIILQVPTDFTYILQSCLQALGKYHTPAPETKSCQICINRLTRNQTTARSL